MKAFITITLCLALAGCGSTPAEKRAFTAKHTHTATPTPESSATPESTPTPESADTFDSVKDECVLETMDVFGVDLNGYGEKRIPDDMVGKAVQHTADCMASKGFPTGL